MRNWYTPPSHCSYSSSSLSTNLKFFLDYDMAAFHVTSYQLLSLITQCHRLRSPVCHLACCKLPATCCLPACLPAACCKLQVGSKENSLSQKQEAFYVLLSFNVSLITLCNTLSDRQRERERVRVRERDCEMVPWGPLTKAWPIINAFSPSVSVQVQTFNK